MRFCERQEPLETLFHGIGFGQMRFMMVTPNVIWLPGYPVEPAYPTGYSRAVRPEGLGSSSSEVQTAAVRIAISEKSKSFPSLKVGRLFWRTPVNAGFTFPFDIWPTLAQCAVPASGHRCQTGIQELQDRGGHLRLGIFESICCHAGVKWSLDAMDSGLLRWAREPHPALKPPPP